LARKEVAEKAIASPSTIINHTTLIGGEVMEIKGKKVLVVGGSSGIGLGVAKVAAHKGARITIASRSKEKLAKAAAEIGGDVKTAVLDVTNEESVKDFFAKSEVFDHIVSTPHSPESLMGGAMAPVAAMPVEAARQFMETKFWGQFFVAKYGETKLSPKGSITVTAGIASKRFVPGHCSIAATNAALGAFTWLFSHEIGPKRCNAVAPGLVQTSAYDFLPQADRKAFFERFANQLLPVKHVATPEEVAQTYIYLMECEYHTGDIICVDGGFWSAA
jgi:NAD(P)-dependent dehydrogenase (short-subunit alcohol dehydrogenase family)